MIDGDCPQLLVTIVVEQCHSLKLDARVIVPVFFPVGYDVFPSEYRQYIELILKPMQQRVLHHYLHNM